VTDHETDPMMQRAVEELKRLPALDRAAVERITAAAAAARLSPADDPVARPTRPRVRMWTTLGLAAAAIVGFIARDLIPSESNAPVGRVAPPASVAPPVREALSNNADVVRVPQQFVLENTTARRVSVVGDFNNWNPNATPMTHSDGGIWSVIVPVVPGRHVYGYMVNDSVFTLDPQKPTARDPDFGTNASVLMVGRP